jgi:DNA-binding transcriptional LysR family regulator
MKQMNIIAHSEQRSCATNISVARTFLEVVKTGSFVAAPASLNLTQAAVSARIRVLEE